MKKDIEMEVEDMKMKAMKEMKEADLTNRITYLNRRCQVLEVLVGKIAERSGMKIEKFADGLVVIS